MTFGDNFPVGSCIEGTTYELDYFLSQNYSILSVAGFQNSSSLWQRLSPHQSERDGHPLHRPNSGSGIIHSKRTLPSWSRWIATKQQLSDQQGTESPDRHPTQRKSQPRDTHLRDHPRRFSALVTLAHLIVPEKPHIEEPACTRGPGLGGPRPDAHWPCAAPQVEPIMSTESAQVPQKTAPLAGCAAKPMLNGTVARFHAVFWELCPTSTRNTCRLRLEWSEVKDYPSSAWATLKC